VTDPSGDAPSPPPSPPPSDSSDEPRRGFRGQFRSTRAAVLRLVTAHVALARAELSEILDEARRVALLAGAALGLVLFAVILVTVGSSLFIGEWLFGSIGWGIVHVTELTLTGALVCVLVAVDVPKERLLARLVPAILVGVVVAVVAGLSLPNRLWEALGATIVPSLEPVNRPLIVGLGVGAGLGLVLGIVAGVRSSARGSLGATVAGALGWGVGAALGGAIVGACSAITFGSRVGIALGVATALGSWAGLSGLEARRIGADPEAFMRKFYPNRTIETTKETIEWVREQTPLGPKS
jgi:hypothetical protein